MKKASKCGISLSLALMMSLNGLSAASFAVETDEVTTTVSETTEETSQGLIDFINIGKEAAMDIDEINRSITLGNSNGDHFAMYNGLEKRPNDFTFEADLEFTSTSAEHALSAGLVFGVYNKNRPNGGWYGANIDTNRINNSDLFRVFGNGIDTNKDGEKRDIDVDEKLHLKLDMTKTGDFIYSFGNAGATQYEITGTIPSWIGGYVGLLSFQSEAVFSNVAFYDRTDYNSAVIEETDVPVDSRFHTNLEQLKSFSGDWSTTDAGLYSNAVDKGDCFVQSESKGSNFVYSTDVSFLSESGAAALLFRSNNNREEKESYAVNLDVSSHKCKFWRWQEDEPLQLIDEKEIAATENETYTLKVVAYDTWISYYVNDVLVASSGDYTLQKDDKGQNTVIKEGYFGLLNWNGEMVFQNTQYTELNESFDPILENISVSSSVGAVEKASQFVSTEPITIQFVSNEAKTVDISAKAASKNAQIIVSDAQGNVYANGKNIPVELGTNIITIANTVTDSDGIKATLTYRVNVYRRSADEVYYNEAYRDQYHYSVQDGWGNDPNGLVYYNGTYHMFYQFYTENKWGPMHWAHATSKDLITWEEQPIALYPDANGAMFSGCIVADENNTSGLFEEGKGGLVAIITADGNGQRMKLAYSTDEGMSWTKLDDIVADWTQDPLGNRDFRDPKVFRWNNKWFMVAAGGPLRIYSSDNLRDWTCESTYSSLHTECPDLYPVQLDNGTVKWVLSRGGRYYKIGDFKQVDGSWKFVPDEQYNTTDGIMNFGKDSYAAMTYYVQDFGTSENPTIPEIIEINWMNTWEDYCNLVGDTVGQNFNGTYNLNLTVDLDEEDGKYVLTQTPIQAYESLRDTTNKISYEKETVAADNTLLKDFSGDCYEIVSTFRPTEGTKKVGFSVRSGENQETCVIYDLENETLSIDRSKSGILLTDKFAQVNSQKVTKNADGSIDLHLYVDRASVEVFAMGNTVAGANQIFPDSTSLGAAVLVEGDAVEADITIYPLNSIWNNNEKPAVQLPFTDVAENDWFYPDVAYVYENDLMRGTEPTIFAPKLNTQRGMIVTVLYRLEGEPTAKTSTIFKDVDTSKYYADAVAWAAENGIVNGYDAETFGPEDNSTREQLATIMYRYAQYKGYDVSAGESTNILSYNDADSISDYALSAIQWMCGTGLMNGSYNNLEPQGNATRAQVAAILHRYCENIVK